MNNPVNSGNTFKGILTMLSLLAVVGAVFITCKKELKDGPSEPTTYQVQANGDDPLFLTAKTAQGVVKYYGKRKEDGSPEIVTDVSITNPGDTLRYKVDEFGRPVKMVTGNGTDFEFKWITADHVVVVVTSANGSNQLNFEMKDLKNPHREAVQLSPASISNKVSPRQHIPTTISFRPIVHNNSAPLNSPSAADTKITVNVQQCGSPANADVYVRAQDVTGGFLGEYPAYFKSKGIYEAEIPSDIAPKLEPGTLCNVLAGVLDKMCYIKDVPAMAAGLCVAMSGAIASGGVTAPVAAAFLGSCEAGLAGLLLYCNTVGNSAAPGTTSLADAICNSQFINKTLTSDAIISAYAVALPHKRWGGSAVFNASGPNLLSIDFGEQSAIRYLDLIPSAPAAGQGYTAKANVYCVPVGAKMKISVVGSDGYKNSNEITAQSTQADGEITLGVPGGQKGVKDVVTLEVTFPDGSDKQARVAYLVFN